MRSSLPLSCTPSNFNSVVVDESLTDGINISLDDVSSDSDNDDTKHSSGSEHAVSALFRPKSQINSDDEDETCSV
jgi:hypothetical protein